MRDLPGRVAVVTGAASGMGRAFARRFAEEQMRVVLADVETEPLEAAVAELAAEGHTVLGVPTDVSERAQVAALAAASLEAFGAVHLLCNNAGVEGYLGGPIWEATGNDWTWTLGVNLWGAIHGIQEFLPILLDQPDGAHVVNTCSMTSLVRATNMYGVAKHALLALSEVLWGDLRAAGAEVGVTALCPGLIATRLFEGSRNRPAALANAEPTPGAAAGDELRRAMHARLAEDMAPSEVADQVVAAVLEDRLYVLTDHDWDPAIAARAEDLMARRNPVAGRAGP